MTPSRSGPEARATQASEDRRLVARVREGDAAALESLYDRYGSAAYGLARRVLADPTLAQDVVQEVFLVVWRDHGRYDETRGPFAGWLLAVVHHKAVDLVRREETLRRRHTAAELLELHETAAGAVDDEVWTGLRGERVRAALGGLPAPQREALTLAYYGGYTQREIASLTDTPLGTVKTRMLAGMRRLRGVLDGLSDSTLDLDGGRGGAPGASAGGTA